MSKKVVNIEKIDLDDFLQKLVSLYEEGMDFIDKFTHCVLRAFFLPLRVPF